MIACSAPIATFLTRRFRRGAKKAPKTDRAAAPAAAESAGARRRPLLSPRGGKMPAAGDLPRYGKRVAGDAPNTIHQATSALERQMEEDAASNRCVGRHSKHPGPLPNHSSEKLSSKNGRFLLWRTDASCAAHWPIIAPLCTVRRMSSDSKLIILIIETIRLICQHDGTHV